MRPFLVCDLEHLASAERLADPAIPWQRFLLSGPPGSP